MYGKLVAAKFIVQAEEDHEYFTFITAEAYGSLESWMKRHVIAEN